jgi:very-short-patch-repair endonuclease
MHARQQSSLRKALLTARAAQMRARPTASERMLFAAIRAQQLGVVFKRQASIGGYIVDFVAPSARLVVEVDGASHVGRARADARRDRVLGKLGYRVLRLDAELVVRQLPVAVSQIREALAQLP